MPKVRGNWLDQNVFNGDAPELLLDAAYFCLQGIDQNTQSDADRMELFRRLERCERLGEAFWFFDASTMKTVWRNDSGSSRFSLPLRSALAQVLSILRNIESNSADVALAAAWLQTREPHHPELHEEIANAIASQLSRLLASEKDFNKAEDIVHWFGMELSNSMKNGAELTGVKIVTNAKSAKSAIFQERLLPTIELLALARQYPSREISGLVDETIVYVSRFSFNNVGYYEEQLLRSPEIKPTLNWPSSESKDIRMPSENWRSFLIYL
jgi:hypothetical protein